MAHFLVTYHGGEMSDDAATVANAQRAFILWATKAGTALTDRGAVVRSTTTIKHDGTHTDAVESPFQGWSVIEAIDTEQAVFILRDHPFLARGGTLQIHQPVQL
jgi:hypothetical protein